MSTEDFRAQVRALLARHPPAASSCGQAARGLSVPLRLCGAGDLDVLVDLIRRVAASPALAAANAAGLLRFELSIDPGMPAAAVVPRSAAPAMQACCDGCARGDACRCEHTQAVTAASATPLLRGVITERDVKALPEDCRRVGTAPRAVLTPLARDALRQRGIAVHPTKES